MTYAPQAVGTHNATITLSSEGAADKVITLKGVATNAPLVVYDPVMLPAAENYITLTSFSESDHFADVSKMIGNVYPSICSKSKEKIKKL